MTMHHRRPVKLNGKTEPRNLSRVPKKKHEAWHMLFNHMNPYAIAHLINTVWLDPDFEFVVRRIADRKIMEEL